jgi:Ca2+-transporting ATPase
MGRRILDNVRKGMVFVLAVHVPIAGLALMPLLLGWPPLFTPVHIAFLELVIDPVCAIVFEAEDDEDDVMARPPRDPAAPAVSGALVRLGLWQGAAALGAVGALYAGLWQAGVDSAQVRAAVFTALVTAVGALVLANRSFSVGLWAHLNRPNRALWAVLGGTSLLLLCALEVPALQAVFSFAALAPLQAVLAVGVGLAVLPLLGLLARRQPVLRA